MRLLLKATVATLEIRKPAGKGEKVASTAYAKVTPGVEDGPPQGWALRRSRVCLC